MSTTNTDYNWYYYIRKKGSNYYLGLINDNGDPPDSALTIDVWYDEMADEISSDDDTLNIPKQFELGFIKGCVYELLKFYGQNRPDMLKEYNDTVYKAIAYQIEESKQPLIVAPLDLRADE